MITPWHDKDGFYKYYTAHAGKLTLKNTTIKWSTPSLFNDPFDNQFELYFEEPNEKLIEESLNRFLQSLTSAEPLKPNQFGPETPAMESLRQMHLQHPDLKYTEEEIAYLREGVIEGMQRVIKLAPETNAEIRRFLADITVFCLSETHDNLLMWSHYAQSHTGVVIRFLSLQEVDSPIMTAQPVRYTTQIPRQRFADLMDFNESLNGLLATITLTKGDVWAYEKEWRIIASLRNKSRTYEILPFAPEEIGAVYLGCRIATIDKNEIIAITRSKYPKAKIFQAEKHPTDFSLIFHEIL
jgi:Protein of unknown function (DUF2971)